MQPCGFILHGSPMKARWLDPGGSLQESGWRARVEFVWAQTLTSKEDVAAPPFGWRLDCQGLLTVEM
eukprot:6465241-Amphidinium_carterae.1